MTIDEFKIELKNNIHQLSKNISDGNIPFSDVTRYINELSVPPLIKFAYLSHPKCTVKEFKKHYRPLVQKTGLAAYNILTKTHLVENMSIIYYVLNIEDESIESIEKLYPAKYHVFNAIGKNPQCNQTFKNLLYTLTNNPEYLTKSAKDVFIF